MEYSTREDFKDAKPSTADETTGLDIHTYYARYAGNDSTKPSAAASVRAETTSYTFTLNGTDTEVKYFILGHSYAPACSAWVVSRT